MHKICYFWTEHGEPPAVTAKHRFLYSTRIQTWVVHSGKRENKQSVETTQQTHICVYIYIELPDVPAGVEVCPSFPSHASMYSSAHHTCLHLPLIPFR